MDGYVAESPNPETYVEQRAYASGNTYADRFLSIKLYILKCYVKTTRSRVRCIRDSDIQPSNP